MMKKHLHALLESLIKGDTDEASARLQDYLPSKFRQLMLGEEEEKEEKEDEGKEDKAEKEEDKAEKEEDKAEKKEKKAIKDLNDAEKEEDKAEMKEGVDSKEREYHGYRHNEKGEVYHKVSHKDNSRGYGYEKVKGAARKLTADGDSGAHAKTGNAYKDKPHKDKPHKDNSRSAKSEDKGKKGLKEIDKTTASPYSDGKKDNRRTDKAARFHGQSRDGKELS